MKDALHGLEDFSIRFFHQSDSSSSSNLLIELISHHCLCKIDSICINNSLLIIGRKKLKTVILDEIFDEHRLHALFKFSAFFQING